MEKSRISSGLPGLDLLIGGGFPQGKSVLLTGSPGSGKSIFCLQYLIAGLTQGEKAVFVAVDEKPSDVLEQASSIGWDLFTYVDRKALLILDAAPYFSARVGGGREKEVDIQKFVGDLSNYTKRMEATRLVIDSIGPVILLRDSVSRIQDQARRLIHSLQNQMGTTNLLTCYPVPRVGEKSDHGVEEFLVAGVIMLGMRQEAGRTVRSLSIRKMRATPLDITEAEFHILNEKGITLEEMPRRRRSSRTGGPSKKII